MSKISMAERWQIPVYNDPSQASSGLIEIDLGKCTGCGLCQRTCPIGVIGIDVERNPETKSRSLVRFDTDIARCMFCGLCVEACPTGALKHTNEFEASTANVINLVMRYVKPGEKHQVFKPVKGEDPVRRKIGEAFKEIVKEWDAPAPLNPQETRGKVRWNPQPIKEEPNESGIR